MIVAIAVIAVLALILIFALVKSAANWNWVQITFVLLVFVMAIFAGIAVSRSMKTRAAWIKQHLANEETVQRQQERYETALYGPTEAIVYDDSSLRGVNASLVQDQIGKGRIWTGGLVEAQGDKVVVTFSSIASQFQQDMRVFGFADGAATVGDQTVSVPINFLGSFRVESVNGDAVTFNKVFVTPGAAGEVENPTTTWSFFEKMPSDSHDVFLQDMGINLADVDMTAYRQALESKYLPAATVGLDPGSPEYEKLLDVYTFDGQPLNEIDAWLEQQTNRIDNRFDPPPDERAMEMQFNENADFIVDSPGSIDNEGAFNQLGQAVDPILHLGENAQIKKDERVIIDRSSAVDGYPISDIDNQEPLTARYDAESVGEYYVRPLRDYPFLLQELGSQTNKMSESKARVDSDIADTDDMIGYSQQQINKRDEDISKYRQDIQNLEQDLAAISDLLQQREAEFNRKQQQIRTYYNQILELYEENTRKQEGSLSSNISAPQAEFVKK